MSDMEDIEAQSLLVVTTGNSPRRKWFRLFLICRTTAIFISSMRGSAAILTGGLPLLTSNTEDDWQDHSEIIDVDGQTSHAATPSEIVDVESNIEAIGHASNVHSSSNSHDAIELQSSQRANIVKIVKGKNLDRYRAFGGVEGVADAFGTDLEKGICGQENINQRVEFRNLPDSKISFIRFLIDACKNWTIFLLALAAILSIAFGMKEEGPQIGWLDGVIIVLTITVLVTFASSRRYYDELQSLKKKKISNSCFLKMKEMEVHVIRDGSEKQINIFDLVYGDVVSLKRGYQIPADGLFIAGDMLEVLDDGLRTIIHEQNPFLFYGSRVIDGNGKMIVTSVGATTVWGESMSKASSSAGKKSKLESRLEKFTTCTYNMSLVISILIFIVSFLRFVIGGLRDGSGYRPELKGNTVGLGLMTNTIEELITEPKGRARALTTLLSFLLMGIMEGIPFVVSIAVNFWNDNILSDKATGRGLLACVNTASITSICTDKIGRLTGDHVEVDKLFVGGEFVNESSMLSQEVFEALSEGISATSEAPLVSWANDTFGLRNTNNFGRSRAILQPNGLNHSENPSAFLLERNGENGKETWLHRIGPVDQIFPMCSHYYDRKGQLQEIDNQKENFMLANEEMLAKELKTVAFACTTVHEQEPELSKDLILVGLLGLKYVNQETIKQTIARALKERGIKITLVSSDDVSVLERIAFDYEILDINSEDLLVLKGEEFRNLNETERMDKVNNIRVLGNCDPFDEELLIKCLTQKRNVVGMVRWRTNDAPALKEADIGIAMGPWRREEARENYDIIIRDGGFIFLVTMIESARCAIGKLQKFVQVQLIMIISSTLINFIGIIIVGDSPMTTIQMFGLNLVMTFIDGMALLTGPLTTEKLVSSTEPLITKPMIRNIVAQCLYQITILVSLQAKGPEIIIIGLTKESVPSMIFNSFILCQFFNLFNARELQDKNFLRGIRRDYWMLISGSVYGFLHVSFVVVEYRLGNSTGLNWKLWATCFLIGVLSWLVDCVAKCTFQIAKLYCFTEVSSLDSPPVESLSNLWIMKLMEKGEEIEFPFHKDLPELLLIWNTHMTSTISLPLFLPSIFL